MPKIVFVTLSCNNAEEARKAMASVALQSVSPSRYLVVDSSDSAAASQIKLFCENANAEYHWVEPCGVYPAMNHALTLLEDDDYVWFINSSDWLAGSQSLSVMQGSLSSGPDWSIGGLARLGDQRNPFHPVPTNPGDFAQLLRTGAIGFPHPAAAMKVRVIRRLGGFDTSLRIAADYKLALGFLATAGNPEIAQSTVAVHVPTGLTSENRFRHAWEKAQSRRQLGSGAGLLREAVIQMAGALSYLGLSPRWKRNLSPFPVSGVFAEEIDSWPSRST